ncbi:MAG TPA: COX15/CtaA family protein, partial [Gemmatimonadaceae bacterium]|nr:COX15/CtaA family protein [Gemmatimonadaceae bacterium]
MTLLRRLAWLSLVLGFGHVVFGAIVRITGSGMGCGDHWPKCHGYWFPPFSRPDLIIEVSHRYFAATLTASIVGLLVLAWMRRDRAGVSGRGGVLRPVGLAAGLVVAAALFGAFTVWLELENKLVIVTHLALAMGLLAALAAVILRAGGPPRLPIYRPVPTGASPFPRGSQPSNAPATPWVGSSRTALHTSITAALVFAAIVMGGLTAHIPGANVVCGGFPLCAGGILPTHSSQYIQFLHRILAFAVFFQVGWLGVALTKRG